MRNVKTSKIRRRSGKRWILSGLALGLGLVLCGPPTLAQETEASSADFQVAKGKKKHRKTQNRPIQLGTSGSNVLDHGNFFCCSGTLGGLIEKDGVQYIVSNNHVIARSNKGKKGEAIVQPGYTDRDFCPVGGGSPDVVAHLTGRKRFKWGAAKANKVDLAIAEVVPGAVRSDGKQLQIGIPGSGPAEAFVGMEVKKGGRTTGLTRGFVVLVGATIELEDQPIDCDGDQVKTARYVNQIIVQSGNNKKFINSGDSGSMLYEDVNQCPAPVGLLFAGSDDGSLAAAAPASEVLKAAKKIKPRSPATFVGCETQGLEIAAGQTPRLRPERVREAKKAMRGWEDRIMEVRGVQGVGIGMTLSGKVAPAIHVFSTEDVDQIRDRLPEAIDGFRVEVIRTDRFVLY